jgi:hypothetical protein
VPIIRWEIWLKIVKCFSGCHLPLRYADASRRSFWRVTPGFGTHMIPYDPICSHGTWRRATTWHALGVATIERILDYIGYK